MEWRAGEDDETSAYSNRTLEEIPEAASVLRKLAKTRRNNKKGVKLDDDDAFQDALASFFERHAPEKVANVPRIMKKYIGEDKRSQLMRFLREKYTSPLAESSSEGKDSDRRGAKNRSVSYVTRICTAAAASDVESIRRLITDAKKSEETPLNLNDSCPHFGAPALHVALSKMQTQSVDILLSLGCSVNSRDSAGGTPLMIASASESTAVSVGSLKKLLNLGANVNAVDGDGLTALHEASNVGNFEAVSLLLDAGGHVNAPAKVTRATPLHMAAAGGAAIGRQDLYNILGIDFDASGEAVKRAYRKLALELHPDRRSRTNCNDASDADRRLKLIQRAYATLRDEELRSRYDHGYARVVDALIKAGADPNALSLSSEDPSSRSTPADIAIRCRRWVLAAKLLIASGEGIHKPQKYGRTVLHHAAAFFDAASVKSLLSLGADPRKPDDLGETPTDIARRNCDAKTLSLFGVKGP